jgi:hypothetical protein
MEKKDRPIGCHSLPVVMDSHGEHFAESAFSADFSA